MRYALVATTGHLLLVDIQSKKVLPLESDRPEYYGISWFAGRDELVLSHSGVNNSDLVDISTYAQSEKGWISKCGKNSRQFLSQPHQILCAPDGRVVCTNTGRNVISVVDFNQPTIFQEIGVGNARWDRLALDRITGDHLNSVFLDDGKLYVMAHGHNNGSKLAVFSYPDLELLSLTPLGKRTGLHNIWVTSEGQRISCHSEIGSLIDIDSAEPLWESGSPVYTRGLAATREHVIVGESQKVGRDLRRGSLSALWILDRKNWRAIDYISLGAYGAVNEVRLLDVPDEAHHGTPLPDVQKFLEKSTGGGVGEAHLQQKAGGTWQSANAQANIVESRLQAARATVEGNIAWTSYHLVYGSPETLHNGAKRAAAGLCLALKQTAGDTTTERFTYALEAGPASHVSAVLGYRGQGGDTHMAALLLQKSGREGVLSVWIHHGDAWKQLPNCAAVFGLPIKGDFLLSATPFTATLSIAGAEVMHVNASTLGLDCCNVGLGIRWIGATVKPLD